MNDIYLLYATDPEVKKDVESFVDRLQIKLAGKLNVITGSYDASKDASQNEAECNKSKTLIAFFDSYFMHDKNCLDLWSIFWRRQETDDTQILFQIAIDESINNISVKSSQKLVLDTAKKIGFYSIGELEEDDIDKVCDLLSDILANSIGKKADNLGDEDKQQEDVYLITEHVDKLSSEGLMALDNLSRNAQNKYFELPPKEQKSVLRGSALVLSEFVKKRYTTNKNAEDIPVVCAIYAGGTVGMIRDRQIGSMTILKQAKAEELIKNLPRLRELDCHVHFYSYENPIDSSNAKSDKWVQLATIINSLYDLYQGFVIIHGANTLAYTASALSFMFHNLDKPVILTGSELSLSDISREAETNVIRSLRVAAFEDDRKIPEVCILYGKSLMRGNRATKKFALDTVEGFYSPNYPDLGTITNDRESIGFNLFRSSKGAFQYNKKMASDALVVICDVYPDMDMELFSKINEHNPDALILRTYGTGGVPDDDKVFMKCIYDLIEQNVIVVSLTQCPVGSVELRLFETNAQLFDMGVVNGGDMTTEAAFCKLKHLFAVYGVKAERPKNSTTRVTRTRTIEDKGKIEDEMMDNLAGELSMETRQIRFEAAEIEKGKSKNAISKDYATYDSRYLQGAVLRLRDVSIIENQGKSNIEIDIEIKSGGSNEVFCNYKSSDIDLKTATVFNINIDVMKNVKKFISPTKPSSNRTEIVVHSRTHDIKYSSLTIVLLFGRAIS